MNENVANKVIEEFALENANQRIMIARLKEEAAKMREELDYLRNIESEKVEVEN